MSSDGIKRQNRTDSDVKQCPACQAMRGVPFSVESALQGEIIVSYRCDQCRHEWQISRSLNL